MYWIIYSIHGLEQYFCYLFGVVFPLKGYSVVLWFALSVILYSGAYDGASSMQRPNGSNQNKYHEGSGYSSAWAAQLACRAPKIPHSPESDQGFLGKMETFQTLPSSHRSRRAQSSRDCGGRCEVHPWRGQNYNYLSFLGLHWSCKEKWVEWRRHTWPLSCMLVNMLLCFFLSIIDIHENFSEPNHICCEVWMWVAFSWQPFAVSFAWDLPRWTQYTVLSCGAWMILGEKSIFQTCFCGVIYIAQGSVMRYKP